MLSTYRLYNTHGLLINTCYAKSIYRAIELLNPNPDLHKLTVDNGGPEYICDISKILTKRRKYIKLDLIKNLIKNNKESFISFIER